MSIRDGLLNNGDPVYAAQGEELRGRDIFCKHCGARMHLTKYPLRDEYYFSCCPGEEHRADVCRNYEAERDAPVLGDRSPEALMALLNMPSKSGKGGGGGAPGGEGGTEEPEGYKLKGITKLKQIIKTGIFDENPFHATYWGSKYRFLDFIIFQKRAKHVWRDSELTNIGARIVNARWNGSLNLDKATLMTSIDKMKRSKTIWLTMFWQRPSKTFVYVRFCLDCSTCYGEIKKKLFEPDILPNGAYYEYKAKQEPLDLLVAGTWATTNKELCREMCPLFPSYCSGCMGAYWAKVNTSKQIAIFDAESSKKDE